ncbi:porin, OprB family [Sphingomonas palmae]|uniref:Porin, OprB family n=1 Tax=Sphingomonas palmae TaxID=1855283 RepID=A0A1H7T518_9SPHN|nr:carbohydrate porin [Sphingomonas palmae]SEL79386.1 porin, OprB family [Sphingomonas palmae]
MNRFVLAASAATVPLVLAQPASAQQLPAGPPPVEQDPALGGKGVRPDQQQTTATPTPPGPVARWQASNGIGKTLRSLRQDGVTLTLNYITDTATNVAGGVRKDIANTHGADVGIDLDLEKLAGIGGTKVHIQAAQFGGVGLQQIAIGNSISPQQSWRPVREAFLSQLNVEHDAGRVNVLAGRMALNTYFFNSPINCAFQSVTMCLTTYGPIQTQGITGFPYTSWGLKGRLALTSRLYVQTGVFDYNPAIAVQGKNGLDFSFFKGPGVMIPVEVGYQTTFKDEPLPGRYKLGAYVNTDGGTSPYFDANGGSSILTGRPRALQGGTRVGLYALVDQTVAASKGGARNTAVFGRMFVNAGTATSIDWSGFIGVLQTGTFAGRDRDTIGAFVSNTRFSDEQVAFWRDRRTRFGGSGAPARNEIIGELNYGFVPLAGVRLIPNIQYIINPDPTFAPTRTRRIPDALVLGLRVDLRAQDLFGGTR